jgi:hypothetical protein
MKKIPALLVLCGLALGAQALAAPPPDAPPNLRFVPFEVIVKFKPGAQSLAKAQLPDVTLSSPSPRFTIARREVSAPHRYRPDEAEAETVALLERLRRRDDVEYAQLNYMFELALTPNDPLFAQQWHYPLISLPSAWDITRGSWTTRIAILDTGRTAHPDLAGRWSALEFNASAPGAPATDNGSWRHGTHVAGIAGGASNNYTGGAGVCHNCQLLNVKVGDTTTGITFANVVSGIHWAVDNGARVINMSFESASACEQATFPALREAIDRAVYNGVTVFAAAGNNAVNVANVTPASCPGVIAVAATDRNNNLAAYSSRGTGIGISAPGGGSFYGAGIGCPADSASGFNMSDFAGAVSSWTTSQGSGSAHCYRHLGGTSMATPHVAGTAGLMLTVNPRLRPDQVQSILRGTAGALPGCGSDCGPGLLNAYSAVSAARVRSTGPCSANPSTSALSCRVDSIGQYVNASGTLVESVFAYGYLWQYDGNGNQLGVARNLRGIPRYATGPCAYAPAGQPCVIDSVTILDYPGAGYVESVTAYGRGWNFDVNGNLWPGGTMALSSVPRFASGPCAYASSPSTCRFDTRNLIDAPEWGGLFESITAYGRYWIFNPSGTMIETNLLTGVSRYASGPCAYRPSGQLCTFDSRELRRLPDGSQIETITAYGRYFEWWNGTPTANHGLALTSIPRMR